MLVSMWQVFNTGHGRFPLSLASKLTDHNVLGIDIRQKVLLHNLRLYMNAITAAVNDGFPLVVAMLR